jgi:predicted nucleic acid-binding protein
LASRDQVIAYLDSSVVLRVLFGQPDALPDWKRIERAVSSELIRVECLRAIDRLRIRVRLDERALGRQRAAMIETLDTIEMVTLDGPVLGRASDPFPTSIGTLDAIHLATALGIRERVPSMIFATHDDELGLAASAMGFEVHGLKATD